MFEWNSNTNYTTNYRRRVTTENSITTVRRQRDIINFSEKKLKKDLPEDTKEAQKVMNLSKKIYFVFDSVLYYESNDVPGRRLVVPEKLRDQVVSENHNEFFAGHFSVKKMLQRSTQYFCWPGMNAAVYKKCESRLACATVQRKQEPALHTIPVGEPFCLYWHGFKEMDKCFDDNRYAL